MNGVSSEAIAALVQFLSLLPVRWMLDWVFGCMDRYAELLADSRGFSEEEDKYFAEQAQYAYESFRNKAALSRGLPIEKLQEVAQVCLPVP